MTPELVPSTERTSTTRRGHIYGVRMPLWFVTRYARLMARLAHG